MEEFFTNLSASSIWLIFGALLIFLEIVVFQGIGFLFAGLGSICVGGFLIAGWIESLTSQFILFFLSSTIWTVVLWKPLKKFIEGKDSGFDDMVGNTVIVYGDSIAKGKMGKIKWSGTIMNCEFQPEAEGIQSIAPETEAVISRISHGLVIIKEKSGNS